MVSPLSLVKPQVRRRHVAHVCRRHICHLTTRAKTTTRLPSIPEQHAQKHRIYNRGTIERTSTVLDDLVVKSNDGHLEHTRRFTCSDYVSSLSELSSIRGHLAALHSSVRDEWESEGPALCRRLPKQVRFDIIQHVEETVVLFDDAVVSMVDVFSDDVGTHV